MANTNQVSISKGNSKMGSIPSVSLPPVKCCPNCKSCCKDCYALKLTRIYKTFRESLERNYNILRDDPVSYFEQVKTAARLSRFFRWHISGDIISTNYLDNMVKMARELKGTQFLAFTKSYEIVNEYFEHHRKPSNLQVIFSLPFDGETIDNPHNLPTAAVIFKGQELDPTYKVCGGNCTECAGQGVGCWNLKKGETVAFYKH